MLSEQDLSLRCCQSQTEKNKKCTGPAVQPLPDRFICAQSFAESRRERRQNEAPNCAGHHKGDSQRKKRQHLRVRCWVDKLRKKCEKEQYHFRIQHIGDDALSKCRSARRSSKVARQTQSFSTIKKHFNAEKNQISAPKQLDCAKSDHRGRENRRKSERGRAGMKNTSERNPERRCDSCFATLGNTAPQNVDRVRTRREIQQNSRRQK